MTETDERACMFCRTPIFECMGFTLARDIVAVEEGRRTKRPRELCGRCAELVTMLRRTPEENRALGWED